MTIGTGTSQGYYQYYEEDGLCTVMWIEDSRRGREDAFAENVMEIRKDQPMLVDIGVELSKWEWKGKRLCRLNRHDL